MRLRGNATEHRVLGIERKRGRRLHSGRGGVRVREDEAGQSIRQRGLADAGRPTDQPGMRHASAAISIEQCALGLVMPEERGGRSRMQGIVRIIIDGCTAQEEYSSLMMRTRLRGCSRSTTVCQTISATSSRDPEASMSTQRSGSRLASS